MKKELLNFISENQLSPFHSQKTPVIPREKSIYKTRDAKSIHQRVLTNLSQNFVFPETSNLLHFFEFTNDLEMLRKRQEFFKGIKDGGKKQNSFLKELTLPRPFWKPRYDVLVVTESTEIFTKLKTLNCPVKLLISENDVLLLESCDIVQVIDCPEFGRVLETLPQAVFLNHFDESYLERYLEKFSGWKNNFEILEEKDLDENLNSLLREIIPLLSLTSEKESIVLDPDEVQSKVDEINKEVNIKLREVTVTGDSLVEMISKGVLPENLKQTVKDAIQRSNLPLNVLTMGIPVKIDEEELEKTILKQNTNEFSDIAEKINSRSNDLKRIPEKLDELQNRLILYDFICGISKYIELEMNFPITSQEFSIFQSKNMFLNPAQPISFHLNSENKCSILTGANSGGKTTLIEHVIQCISLLQIGLPISGNIRLPIFTDIYYFAKNKGSISKGAFETLLEQMSKIVPGTKTLILADEIEAVTEPGVAGDIISATADYYIKKDCFLIIATHLGHEIIKCLPAKTRIDGIEAKGLDENYELIVDHNPVIGRLAHSTPELIVEKMANNSKGEYFTHLNDYLKNKSN